ncbi:LAFA_0C06150g1_1 [Lachancea sp. 'fantastica']|nr:LAFA_0C06150g1_1 [Lachancea sp. 'fantastica']
MALMQGLLLLLWAYTAVADWSPKVKKSKWSGVTRFQSFEDSPVILAMGSVGVPKISKDNGENWSEIKTVGRSASFVQVDPNYKANRAFIFGGEDKKNLYMTTDQGDFWSRLNVPFPSFKRDSYLNVNVQSNGLAESDLLVIITICDKICTSNGFVTSDLKNFKEIQLSEKSFETINCQYSGFAGREDTFHNILCDASYADEGPPTQKVIVSKNGGAQFEELEQFQNSDVREVSVTSNYVVISTVEDRYNSDSSQALWISRDGQNFEKALLPTGFRGSFYVSPLSKHSNRLMLLSGLRGLKYPGHGLVLSDSEGLKFSPVSAFPTDHAGIHMVSDVSGLEGVLVCSFTDFFDRTGNQPTVTTKISFDGGWSWSNLRVDDVNDEFDCDTDDPTNCSLSALLMPSMMFGNEPSLVLPGLHYLVGFVGEEKATPGMGPNMQTFITNDGGETWKKAFDFPVAIQYGDYGNIMVAFPFTPDSDGDPAAEFYYSLDQGETWVEYQLKEQVAIGSFSATTIDGSGTRFIMQGMDFKNLAKSWLYSLDFSDLFDEKKCGEDDMDDWYSNGGNCIDGTRRKYTRRKYDAECLIRETYRDLEFEEEVCQCTEADYECSPEFYLGPSGDCELDFGSLEQSQSCRAVKKGEKLKLPPKKLQRGNKCDDPLAIDPKEINCDGLTDSDRTEPVVVFENTLQSELKSYQYFNTISDETVLFRDTKNEVYVSYDSGRSLKKLMSKVTEVIFNPYFNTSAYIFGADNQLHITNDRARTFQMFKLPESKQLGFPLSFHAKDPDTFIYYGGKGCESFLDPHCHVVAYITRDGGNIFTELKSGARNCDFVGSLYEEPSDPDMLLCSISEPGSRGHSLVTSVDFFESEPQTVFEHALGFVSVGEYTVVAIPHEDQELRAFVTIDGQSFAEAKLPAGLGTDKQQAYTVLGSQKGAIFFHLTTHMNEGQEFGALMKSNSNGTSFVTLERAVNRGPKGFVDFEKLEGLEGIILINTVDNVEELESDSKAQKRLKSKISFNDGADWTYLEPPIKDSEGKKYKCNPKNKKSCSLNLHGYTERTDQRDTYSSGSALGFVIGVGNVGEYLLPVDECSTFISVDGGFTWKEIKKGVYQWEYGDRGSIIVLVKDRTKTDSLIYSVDSGESWIDHKFSDEEVYVEDLVTTPQDSAMRFLIIGKSSKVTGKQTRTYTVDFTNAFERQCNLQSGDYVYRSFGECLFGHKAEYLQKVNDKCYNGAAPLDEMMRIAKTCACTRMDFECDYNFFKAADGTCKLVEGTEPLDGDEMCEKYDDLIEYFEPTGYRKIPLSTCQGGLELDKSSRSHACPGFEEEFRRRHRVTNGRLVAIIIIPIFVFITAAWFVYDRGVKRNGGLSRFGEIRLGDEELIEQNGLDKVVNSIVKVGVLAFSGLVTAKQLSTRAAQNTWQRLRSRLSGNTGGPTYFSLNRDQFLDEADELLAGHDEDANDLTSFLHDDENYDIPTEEEQSNDTARPYRDEVDEPDNEVRADETTNS